MTHPMRALGLAAALAAGFAQAQDPDAPVLDPEALAAVQAMGQGLRAIEVFSVEAELVSEIVLESGEKLTSVRQVTGHAQAPDKLRYEVSQPGRERIFYYDGRHATIWGPLTRMYAQVPFEGPLAAMIDEITGRYQLEIPLSDLILWGREPDELEAITSAAKLGAARIGGRLCEHYAFRQPDLDWQIWIEAGETPQDGLPCRYQIVDLTDEARPMFMATLEIRAQQVFDDGRFTFVPPEDAERVRIAEPPAESDETVPDSPQDTQATQDTE